MRYLIDGEMHAAHRLDDYKGKCANLHGHTYSIQIVVNVPNKDVFKDGSNRAVDFAEVKGIFKAHVAYGDHACWLSRPSCNLLFGEEYDSPAVVCKGQRIIVTDGEPTAELMARLLFQWMQNDYRALGESRKVALQLISVTVWETAEQGATYAPGE